MKLKSPGFNTNRVYYLDVARFVAIISISLNHAVNYTYELYDSHHMAEFLSHSMFSACIKSGAYFFSRLGVPLFLMITGALLLDRKMDTEQQVKKFYTHNVFGLFITAELWYGIMYLVVNKNALLSQGLIVSVYRMLAGMFTLDPAYKSLWYIPMILGLYMTIPVVILAKDNAPASTRKFLLIPCVIVFLQKMLVPAMQAFAVLIGVENDPDAMVSLYSTYIYDQENLYQLVAMYYIYVILGYAVKQGFLSKFKDWQVGALAISVFLLCCGYQCWAFSRPQNYLIDYDFPLLPVCAVFLFEFIKRKAHWLSCLRGGITYVSRISFAVYFLHMIIMSEVNMLNWFAGWHKPVEMFALEAIAILGSIVIIWPLSQIKLLRKYLFMIK